MTEFGRSIVDMVIPLYKYLDYEQSEHDLDSTFYIVWASGIPPFSS